MDFFVQILLMTIGLGVVGSALVSYASKNSSMLGVLGAFLLMGTAGGLVLLGFLIAAKVWYEVSRTTFGLLGIDAAAPFVLLPMYLLVKLLSKGGDREYDGRGFGDGDGGN